MKIRIPKDQLAEFCRKNHIRKLALFGSVLRDDFRPDSDVDVLVEFKPGHMPGFRFISLQEELSHIFGGRPVDLVTPKFLNRRIRAEVLSSAEVQYAEPDFSRWLGMAKRAPENLNPRFRSDDDL